MNVTSALATALEAFPPDDGSQACADVDPELFFAPDGQRGERRRAQEAQASAVCHRCQYVTECLAYAMALDVRYGVWAGHRFHDDVHQAPTPIRPAAPTATPRSPAMPATPTPPANRFAAVAELLASTEGHADPTVRAVRRIAAQSLDALHTLVAGLEQLGQAAKGLDAALTPVTLVKPPQLDDSPRAMLDEEPAKVDQSATRAGKSSTALLMEHHGITSADVRAWAATADVSMPATGLIARRYVDQYIDANVRPANR